MTNATLVLGADGGGTKTLGLLADAEGKILSRVQVGGSNQNVIGTEAAAANLTDLILRCTREAGRSAGDLGGVVLGLAGAGGDQDRQALIRAIQDTLARQGVPPLRLTVETDARIALEGAFDGGPGVVVIAGTGSVVIGKTAAGEILRIGGWGRVLGDEGSGYFIGLQALRALTLDFDGRAPAGRLKDVFAARFAWTSREAVIASVYREKCEIPALAPLVLDAAAEQDPVALGILRHAAELLTQQVSATANRLGSGQRAGVVFFGGLIDHDTPYASLLRAAIATACPNADVRRPLHSPAEGAVFMALARSKDA